MSNYPPGVSGLEYEIAGPDNEWEDEFECENLSLKYIRIPEHVFEYCSSVGKRVYRTSEIAESKENIYQILARLNVMFNSPEIGREVITEECGFIGTVLKESYKNQIWWTCPNCGKGYEETIERYRDDY
jgi:predicted RNA-binding Zn-ribbon protein involved in translation (DUF1610 family)